MLTCIRAKLVVHKKYSHHFCPCRFRISHSSFSASFFTLMQKCGTGWVCPPCWPWLTYLYSTHPNPSTINRYSYISWFIFGEHSFSNLATAASNISYPQHAVGTSAAISTGWPNGLKISSSTSLRTVALVAAFHSCSLSSALQPRRLNFLGRQQPHSS